MRVNNLIFLLSFILIGFTSCKNNENENQVEDVEAQGERFDESLESMRESGDLTATISGNAELSTFATGLDAWNVEDSLENAGEDHTIFAPNNMAYSKIYQKEGQDVLDANSNRIIPYHIVKTGDKTGQLRQHIRANDSLVLQTMEGDSLSVSLSGNNLQIRGGAGDLATVIDSMEAGNGMVYIIDNVLLPGSVDREVTITAEE